jgi:putative Holliday junction resolvase
VLGVDHGQARIGLALSDPTGMLATPLAVHERRRRRRQDITALATLAREHEVGAVVIGIPVEMSGERGKKAHEVEQFAEALRTAVAPVPVYEWDERMSTVAAYDLLREAGHRERHSRARVDAVAAAVILQGWLDAHPAREP